MAYFRNPETGRFITEAQWKELQQEEFVDVWEDWEDLDDFDELGEEQIY